MVYDAYGICIHVPGGLLYAMQKLNRPELKYV